MSEIRTRLFTQSTC